MLTYVVRSVCQNIVEPGAFAKVAVISELATILDFESIECSSVVPELSQKVVSNFAHLRNHQLSNPVLEPLGDGFRNYFREGNPLSPDKANILKLPLPR